MTRTNLVETKLAQLRQRHWSDADARIVLAQLEASGDSVSAFARAHGLSAKRIYWWRTRLSDNDQRGDEREQLSFAPVVVTGLAGTPAVIVRIGEVELAVVDPQRVEPTWLAQVLAAMKESA